MHAAHDPKAVGLIVRTVPMFVLMGFLTSANADVTFHVKEYLVDVAVEIHVTGEIREADTRDLDSGFAAAKQFAAARRKSADTTPHFVLNSQGGNVLAGSQIGRWARAKQASAEVDTECSSACVLILAGAVHRAKINGKVGIHRIYFSSLSPESTYRQVREKMARTDEFVSTYLREMDVPLSLLEEMKSVPPDRVRYLSTVELQRYRLVGVDPAYQERADTRDAARYGLSREEYYRRKARADTACRQGTFVYLDCWEDVIKGKK